LQAQFRNGFILQAEAVAKADIREGVLGLAAHGEAIVAEGEGAGVPEVV